ncbi:MAG: extracellular solute-binding protein [Patescibacteria group bacterium]
MKDNFQVIILVVFIALAVLGVLVFSGAIPLGGGSSTETGTGTVLLWGTVSAQIMNPIVDEFNNANSTYKVQYEEKQAATFDQDLLEALAAGKGPDMFFLPDDLAYHYSNKIFTIPYTSYPLASFENNFAGAGDVFLTSGGMMAFPLTIDPLIMYYNRSILDANNIVYPPKDWDEFANQVQVLTKKDDSNKIIKSGTALGQFSNVTHAKDILSTLFMQLGDKIVTEKDGLYTSALSQDINLTQALGFYTDFADPAKSIYSWNKSFPNSRDYFSTDNLAFYFGYAGEFESLVNKNPNQNFQVAAIPQIKNTNFKLTGANVTGIAISSFSKNFNTAFIAAGAMSAGTFAKSLADALGIAPARRDLLANPPQDAYSPAFYASALYARAWLDPSPKDTDSIFRTMVESVLSNSLTPQNSIKDASGKLDLLLLKQ